MWVGLTSPMDQKRAHDQSNTRGRCKEGKKVSYRFFIFTRGRCKEGKKVSFRHGDSNSGLERERLL